MNGSRYQIFMASSAHKRYKKFDSGLQQKIKEEAQKISEDPYIYNELKGPLKGIRSYHFYQILRRIVIRS